MEINASHEELNIFNILTGTKSTNPLHNTNPSIFNALIQKNAEENKESSLQKLRNLSKDSEKHDEKIKKATTAINEQKNISLTPNTSNTHGELSLILQLRKLLAS